MGLVSWLFGSKPVAALPAGPVVRELARWGVARASGGPEAVVRYGHNAAGELTIDARGGDPEAGPYVAYYLLDPSHVRPVFIEGLGPQQGPHTRTPEQFERAMSVLSVRHTAWTARKLGGPTPPG